MSKDACIGHTYAQIEAQLIAMHLDDPVRLSKEHMPTVKSMVRDGWAKPCPKHPGYYISGSRGYR